MDIIEAICAARGCGLSVTEIARVLKWKAGTVHDILVKQKRIEPMAKRYRPADTSAVHGAIIKAMKVQDLSLGFREQWNGKPG